LFDNILKVWEVSGAGRKAIAYNSDYEHLWATDRLLCVHWIH